jgi:SAM-dependent methyltransferase
MNEISNYTGNKIVTPHSMALHWEEYYSSIDTPVWEMLPLGDEAEFLNRNIKLEKVKSILDIGCGRGRRIIKCVSTCEKLNRTDVKIVGIDISKTAINSAMEYYAKIGKEVVNTKEEGCINPTLSFFCADILDDLPEIINIKYDLVVDWMCFHEVFKNGRQNYVEKINALSKNYFILNVFSNANDSIFLTEAVKQIPKYCFSREDIEKLFSKYFMIISSYKYPASTGKPHPDGKIAAKEAFLLVKLQR